MNNLLVTEWFLPIYFSQQQRDNIIARNDPVRYGSILLAMEQIRKENIFGSFAECGVYKGTLSKFIHDTCPERIFYLFDTFKGFDKRDLESGEDDRFSDTDVTSVQRYIGGNNNIIIRKGFFPETTAGITGERFSLVILDFDKYNPTLAGLNFFYPLMNIGGFIFVHDYSSPESNWACSRALNEFLTGKPEKPILIPDSWGSAIIRKV